LRARHKAAEQRIEEAGEPPITAETSELPLDEDHR
jgi:hypothetical protein